MPQVHYAFLQASGKLTVLDANRQPIPYFSGYYSIQQHKRILLEAAPTCQFLNFDLLPRGFTNTCMDFATYYREQKLTWEQIPDNEKQ